jgi:FkbM family methyltransferase
MFDTPEQTPGYRGLYGEVVTEDIYHIRSLAWQPDVVIDLGANIGVFTRYAAELFPSAKIVAVEPHPENFEHLRKFTPDEPRITLINAAISRGKVWRHLGAANGSGESYVSVQPGFRIEHMVSTKVEPASVRTIMPDVLIDKWVLPGQRSILKMDIEGGEAAVFDHLPSMEALKRIDYIAAEVHFYAAVAELADEARDAHLRAFESLEATHDCTLNHVHFYATKR